MCVRAHRGSEANFLVERRNVTRDPRATFRSVRGVWLSYRSTGRVLGSTARLGGCVRAPKEAQSTKPRPVRPAFPAGSSGRRGGRGDNPGRTRHALKVYPRDTALRGSPTAHLPDAFRHVVGCTRVHLKSESTTILRRPGARSHRPPESHHFSGG